MSKVRDGRDVFPGQRCPSAWPATSPARCWPWPPLRWPCCSHVSHRRRQPLAGCQLAARRSEGLAGGRGRDLDGLVDRRDIHGGVDGLAVDRLDLGNLPRVMLAIEPDMEVYGAVAQCLQCRGQGLAESRGERLEGFSGTEGARVLGTGYPVDCLLSDNARVLGGGEQLGLVSEVIALQASDQLSDAGEGGFAQGRQAEP